MKLKEKIKLVSRPVIILSLLIISFNSSCSSKKKDTTNGVPVFQGSVIKADSSLAKINIVIPNPQLNESWLGQNNNTDNQIENFAFTDKITKTKSIWSGKKILTGDPVASSPIIVRNVIYLLDATGSLLAQDLSSGKMIWNKKIVKWRDMRNFTGGKISYNGGTVFVSTGYDLVFAINAKTGEIIWSKNIGGITISAPIADENQVFITTNDNKTYALNISNGEINWVHSGILRNTGILGAANPIFYKNYVLIAYSSGEVYALDKKNGDFSWSYDLNINKAVSSDFILNDIDSTPIIKDDIVYAIGNGGLMMAISIKNGNVLWKKELSTITDSWVAGDFIYLINNDNQLICLYRKTGEIKWLKALKKYIDVKKPDSKIIYNGIIMGGGNLVLSNSYREVLIVSALNGNILQTVKTKQNIYHSPIIVAQKLYLQTVSSFAVDLMVMD